MDPSIEEIAFLASSDHRRGVLDVLTAGPADRSTLRSATGASSPTMGRMLSDFEERRWITREGSVFELTPLGAFVSTRFVELHEAISIERKLRSCSRLNIPTEFGDSLWSARWWASPAPARRYRSVS